MAALLRRGGGRRRRGLGRGRRRSCGGSPVSRRPRRCAARGAEDDGDVGLERRISMRRGGAAEMIRAPPSSGRTCPARFTAREERARRQGVRGSKGKAMEGENGWGRGSPRRGSKKRGGGPTNSGEQNAQPGGTVQGEKRGESERRASRFIGQGRGAH